MSLLVHATCFVAHSFFFCCHWVDGVAMLSVVKRNILKGISPPPPPPVLNGTESGGVETKKKREREKIYIEGSCFLALLSFTPTPKIINFCIEENCLVSLLVAWQRARYWFIRASSDDCLRHESVYGCSCLSLSSSGTWLLP